MFMSVKILILKSLEDVIAGVTKTVSGYIIENPYVVNLEEDRVRFYPYAPLSKDTSISIPYDWVVSIVEPLDEIKKSYVDKINEKSQSISD